MAAYDFLLFDADNTLFDFDRSERHALRLTLEEIGCRFDSVTEALYVSINRALWDRLDRGEISQDRLVVERFAAFLRVMGREEDPAALNRAFLDHLGQASYLLPGAAQLCERLSSRYTLAIITNGFVRAQRGRLERSPLNWLLPRIFVSEALGASKPQPAFFHGVFRALDIQFPSRVLVIGDNLRTDVQGGMNAGTDALWFNPRGLPCAPGITPTYEARSFDEIADLLLGGGSP